MKMTKGCMLRHAHAASSQKATKAWLRNSLASRSGGKK